MPQTSQTSQTQDDISLLTLIEEKFEHWFSTTSSEVNTAARLGNAHAIDLKSAAKICFLAGARTGISVGQLIINDVKKSLRIT